MPVIPAATILRRARSQDGFTMLMALGVLLVTSLLCAAVFRTIGSEVQLTRTDLDAKRAYAAAQAGLQAYKYLLNDNATNAQWWENCANDTVSATPVAGSTTGVTYSYAPVPVSPATTCVSSDPAGSLIDPTTGSLRMVFTGQSGHVTKSIVASFKTLSPLSFLWYTVHETEDTNIGGSSCATFYAQGTSTNPASQCRIEWVTGDNVQGPMYTWDQFLIGSGQKPILGRPGSADTVSSQVPTNKSSQDVCVASNCQGATIANPTPDVNPEVPYPSDNANLLTDAQSHGLVFAGNVTLYVNGSTATAYNCPTTTVSSCTTTTIDLTAKPIIYATSIPSGCSAAPAYRPSSKSGQLTYPSMTYGSGSTAATVYGGACGDIYVQGNYTVPMTIGSDNDIIVTGDLTTTEGSGGIPTGKATAGLVADRYVRVMHTCAGNPDRTIDAGILALDHSFFVDNYDCGTGGIGELNVHGAIAQYFRGIVGTSGGTGSTGYLKNYIYDPRLAVIFPPYMFDLQKTSWLVYRESLCNNTASGATAAGGCSQ